MPVKKIGHERVEQDGGVLSNTGFPRAFESSLTALGESQTGLGVSSCSRTWRFRVVLVEQQKKLWFDGLGRKGGCSHGRPSERKQWREEGHGRHGSAGLAAAADDDGRGDLLVLLTSERTAREEQDGGKLGARG
ncbi:hypothetical protein CFC21_052088 [Triticum aestivum]|uniref:Uncharacterized protein n=3 Tax=Triticum TaxID=4564 RepID=A0A9R0S835_TRITD|nr:hypothetical protein CFC21_052088 [Triticum aestivum]VAH90499.1 unnamed protein product [Triticum turgidum subsp. durum]